MDRVNEPHINTKDSSKDESIKNLAYFDLETIIDNSYDSIFVTDKFGNVLLCNESTGRLLDTNHKEIIGKNVRDLVHKLYTWSPTLKAIETKAMVTGILQSTNGTNIMVTSTPLIDDKGEIIMVVTNARDKDMLDKYVDALEKERTKAERYKTAVEYLTEVDVDPVVAESQQMRHIIQTTRVIARTDSTVLLVGESGTGKEVMAKYIHRNSRRSKEPFIPVNCAAIPSELLESEFFGYVPGAFTGASSRGKPGFFEIADKGTLFLDEIGELPLAMQSKLLRVLETGEIQLVGSSTIQQTNVRLIAATNRDLKAMINQKLFRSDLYYRLNVIPVNLPPLRERPDDILVLANRFLEDLNKKYGFRKVLSSQALHAFLNYNWPGNVCELRNVIERLVITSTGDELYFERGIEGEFPGNKIDSNNCQETDLKAETALPYKGTLKDVLRAVEEEYIKQVIAECGGKVGEAAQKLGIHRTMLYRKTRDK